MADPDETIDGAEPAGSSRALPPPVLAALGDYGELSVVDRNRYVITRELAKGGMGRVFEARDLRLGRQVAIKELLPKNRDIARRFEREARITARLQHPAIIHVYEAGVWPGGEPFYAMPIVNGRSLDKVVAEKHTLAERLWLLPRVIAVADALAYAHNENVIHRDLKPANVLVGEFGETVVIDWGLAEDLSIESDVKVGSIVGTPAYMPPEQARGDRVDQRADVYALGALLYKVLSGAAPYRGASSDDVLAQVKAGAPVPVAERVPEAPLELVAIVNKAMAREPRDRYASAAEVAQDLKRFETGQLVGAHHYTAGQLVRRWLRRHRVVVGTSAVALAILAVVAAVSIENVIAARDRAEARRVALLEERGRAELLAGNAGPALVYLLGASHDGASGGARGFLIAEAMRPFLAEAAVLTRSHGNVIVAASSDGRHIATACRSGCGEIELWRSTGQRERVLDSNLHANVIAFDPTNQLLAAGGESGTVRVWKLDGSRVADLAAHHGAVFDIAFAPDGRLATAGADGQAYVWDLATATPVAALCKSASPFQTARVSPSGTLAIAGAEDGTACVWNTRTGEVYSRLRGHTGAITAVRWGPDDTWVVTASEDGSARVWGAEFAKLITNPLVHERPVTALEVSADGSLVVTGDDVGGVRIWKIPASLPSGEDGTTVTARGGARLARHADKIVSIAFGDGDGQVATAGADRLVTLWDTHTTQPLAMFEQAEPLTSVAFVGTHIVTGSRDGTARVWDPGAVVARTHVVDSAVKGLAVSSAGVVAAARQDSVVELLEPADVALDGPIDSVYAAAFTPDGKTLIAAGEDLHPFAWDVATRRRFAALPDAPGPISGVVAAPDNEHFATFGRDVRVWSLATRSARVLDSRELRIRALAYSPSGDLLVGGSGDGDVIAWNAAGAVVMAPVRTMPVTALAFAPDGRSLAIGGQAEARIYRMDTGRLADRPAMTTERTPGVVRAIVFACAGACLVTAGESGTADIWDAAKGKHLGTRNPHAGPVSALALGDHGDTLWIATEGKSVGAWDIHVESRASAALACFVADRVPWRLGADDVVSRTEGGSDEQRRANCK